MTTTKTHILKFGGTSLQNRAFIEQAAQIVAERAKTARPLVVVSAIGGTTDTLIKIAEEPEKAVEFITALEQQHEELFNEFTSLSNGREVILQSLFGELRQTVQDYSFRDKNYTAWRDRILSIGERASALIFAAALSKKNLPAKSFNASKFIKTKSNFDQAEVKSNQSRKLIKKYLQGLEEIPVITGFIGSDDEGYITTLGRSGSDYTAGLIAAALDACHLEIWTDVNGVLTADPHWVPAAQHINELSFDDIEELSVHGANVIHPKTIRPIREKATSVLVKNSYNPAHPGTLISRGLPSNGSLKTITVTGPFTWLRVDGGHTHAVLDKLHDLAENANSAKTIAFKQNSKFEPGRLLVDQSFFRQIQKPLKKWADEQSVIIKQQSGIYKVKKFSNHFAGGEQLTNRIWNLLASKNLQPLYIERNRDERFISFLFEENDARNAARLLDDYLHYDKTVVNLFLAGTGAIGETLLQQIRETKPEGIEFRVVGICNSRNTLWDDRGIKFEQNVSWQEAQTTNWNSLLKKLTHPSFHNLIFVDATGSSEVARLYPRLFRNGIHVVTPSKLANTFEQSFFDELRTKIRNTTSSFRYETTVGAGLPVISTLQDLQRSGDKILEISGVVSGTMTYLFNEMEKNIPFSEAVIKARELGYAEPDPRDDLSGEDVARKFLTIVRTLGLKIERDELKVESLIPEELVSVGPSAFLAGLAAYDSFWRQRLEKAQKQNKTLRYTGRLKDGKITIGIQSVPISSPLGQLRGTDNLIQISSRFYNQTPLIIQGPGAGKEVTAAGVLTDVLKVADNMK